MRLSLLVNPTAGGNAAARVAGSVADTLREAGEVRPVMATDAASVARHAARAVADEVDVLAVLGGDGTAHLAANACAGSGTAFATIPAGSGNDLAAALGVPSDPIAAARSVLAVLERPQRMDLGRIHGGAWFSTVLCAGFDSAVNARVNALRWPRGRRRYDLGVLAELRRFRPAPLVVRTDTETVGLDAMLVAVGNTRFYGGGVPICPAAAPNDGLLDVTIIGAVSRRSLLRILPSLRRASHLDHPAVRTLRTSRVELTAAWTAYADGERQGALPITVTCHPAALRVAAPAAL